MAFEFSHNLFNFRPAVFEFFHAIHFPRLPGFLVKIERFVQERPGEIEQIRRPHNCHLDHEPCVIVMQIGWHRKATYAFQMHFTEAQIAVPLSDIRFIGSKKLCRPWLNSFLAVQEPDATIYTEAKAVSQFRVTALGILQCLLFHGIEHHPLILAEIRLQRHC